jgi:hypothetical protein
VVAEIVNDVMTDWTDRILSFLGPINKKFYLILMRCPKITTTIECTQPSLVIQQAGITIPGVEK